MNLHLSVVSQTFVMSGVNLREIGVISVIVMNFPHQFETNICVKTIPPASTVKRETLIHFFCQVLKFNRLKYTLNNNNNNNKEKTTLKIFVMNCFLAIYLCNPVELRFSISSIV